jgi:hypothetical protein
MVAQLFFVPSYAMMSFHPIFNKARSVTCLSQVMSSNNRILAAFFALELFHVD